MQSLVNFFVNIGKLRKVPRRGGVLIGSKNPATIIDHLFRTAIMAWALGKEKKTLSLKRVLELALIHDLCELYVGDLSPYDYKSILPKDKRKWSNLFEKWPRFSMAEKKKIAAEKHRRESKALDYLIKGLPREIKTSIKNAWLEYDKNSTKEARFVKQVNRLEALLQALEYGKEEKIRVYNSWWTGSKERIDDPVLIKFMDSLAEEFLTKKGKK